jgi:phosphoribosylanthranilate isomerase
MTIQTRIKICGITRLEDALSALELGADALGFVFVQKSPRYIEPAKAAEIIAQCPPFASIVGLFMDHDADFVRQVMNVVPMSILQFHGDESADYCQSFTLPYIKAIPMGAGVEPVSYADAHPASKAFLLDSHGGGKSGGSGETFDWDAIPKNFARPLILAGGLDANNVKSAVTEINPYAVDISSGVEAAKGIKDAQKMASFIAAVKEGDGINANAS